MMGIHRARTIQSCKQNGGTIQHESHKQKRIQESTAGRRKFAEDLVHADARRRTFYSGVLARTREGMKLSTHAAKFVPATRNASMAAETLAGAILQTRDAVEDWFGQEVPAMIKRCLGERNLHGAF
jgi:hypothetical protein